MYKMRSLMAFVIVLSFGSCFSLKNQGLWSDGDSTNLKAFGFHRKTLVRNSFTNNNNKPTKKMSQAAATVTPPTSPAPSPSPKHVSTKRSSTQQDVVSPSSPSVPLANPPTPRSSSDSVVVPLVIGCVSGAVLLLLVASGFYFYKSKSGKSVNPWRTGLSGQLQKVFVTAGIPVLKRSEIEAACEDFSNVIGSCPIGKLYKGTLSSGVEIAVASIATTSAKDWKDNTEVHFRNKIEMLSKINHKNFVNLLGCCEENEPFTRILIFEYAPNGSLFEHLHDKESEHLDWGMRLRIAMGLAYCLDHMHQLNPSIAHTNLVSSSLQLTEDYAVKVADFSFGPPETETCINNTIIDTHEDNVYSFGLLLFEMITGKLPESVNKPDSVDNGLVDFLRGEALAKMLDPTLESYDEKIENIGKVIKSCLRTDPKERPTMREVTGWLREITGILPNDAMPKLSPLWWAELEVLSSV